MSVRFSVVIPSYNRRALLERTLATVFAQSHAAHEIIVVDDGSTDGSVAYLRSLGERVRVLQQANAGPGPARNLGAGVATAEYLAFLDSDDLWLPWTLEVYAGVIARRGGPSVLCAFPRTFEHEAEITALPRGPERIDLHADYLAADPIDIVPGAGTLVVRREVFAASGGFARERINAEDADLYLRLGTAPGFAVVREPVVIGYRTHPGAQNLDMRKSVAGRQFMAAGERAGRYPGGPARRTDRLRILTSHLRSGAVEAVYVRDFASAWRLYAASVRWNLAIGRARFVLAFPALWLAHLLRLKRPPLSAPRTRALLAAAGAPGSS